MGTHPYIGGDARSRARRIVSHLRALFKGVGRSPRPRQARCNWFKCILPSAEVHYWLASPLSLSFSLSLSLSPPVISLHLMETCDSGPAQPRSVCAQPTLVLFWHLLSNRWPILHRWPQIKSRGWWSMAKQCFRGSSHANQYNWLARNTRDVCKLNAAFCDGILIDKLSLV